MKKLSRVLCLMLVLSVFFSVAACKQTTNDPTEPSLSPEEQILADRRNIVEQHMRRNATLLWRSEEDITYSTDGSEYKIVAGRVYQGVPYSFAGGTQQSFLDYASEPDDKGIYTLSGLDPASLNDGDKMSRIGNDCSSAVILAWGEIGTSVQGSRSGQMLPKNGFIPVGDYKINVETDEYVNTKAIVLENGYETMYKAYTQLQKGDCLAYVNGPNHAFMVVSVTVEYDAEGNIDPDKSYVTILEQTRDNFLNGKKYEDETLGETVYVIGGVDVKKSFSMLVKGGYLPFTCKELIDPAPVAEATVSDSENVFTKDSILVGSISSNRFIDAVTIQIKDGQGNVVQQAAAYGNRFSYRFFDLQKFVTDRPESVRGNIDPTALSSGNYHCTLVCRLTTGEEFTVRDFDFII